MRRYAFLMACVIVSCSNPEQGGQNAGGTYFDLKGYFGKQAKALAQRNPTINKSVIVNGAAEQKQLKIEDWEKELSSFIDADINKKAWQGEFKSVEANDVQTYTSNNEKVPVRKLQVFKSNGEVTGITIMIENSNYLYRSRDTLIYYPDSLYQIRKSQQIKLMEPKNYRITGTFKK